MTHHHPSTAVPRQSQRVQRVAFAVVRLQEIEVGVPLVPDHLTAREASHGDDHRARSIGAGAFFRRARAFVGVFGRPPRTDAGHCSRPFGRDVGIGIRGVASPHVSRVGPRLGARAVDVARRESDVRARDDDDDGARGDDDGRGFARRVARRSSESSRARLRGTIGDGASREVGDGDGDVRSGV